MIKLTITLKYLSLPAIEALLILPRVKSILTNLFKQDYKKLYTIILYQRVIDNWQNNFSNEMTGFLIWLVCGYKLDTWIFLYKNILNYY